MGSNTPNLNLYKPTPGDAAEKNIWGGEINNNLDILDGVFKGDGTGTGVGLKAAATQVWSAIAGTLKAAAARFFLVDETDNTKVLKLDLSGITTGTTRTLKVPDKSGTLAVSENFNVKDYGAKGDGSTNDTTAIQNAINAAAASISGFNSFAPGAAVYFPPGVYVVTSTLRISTAGVSLQGAGSTQSQIYRTTDYGDTVYCAPTSLVTATYQAGNHIKDLSFYHNNATAPTSGAHVHHAACRSYEVRGVCLVGHFGGFNIESCNTGITYDDIQVYTDFAWSSLVTNSYCMHFGENASVLGYKPPTEIFVSNFNMKGGNKASGDFYLDRGIWIESGDALWFSNGHVGFAGNYGALLQPSSSSTQVNTILFSNVYFDGSFKGGYGMLLVNSNAGTLTGVQCSNCVFQGHVHDGVLAFFTAGTCNDYQFVGCHFDLNTGLGLNISGGDNYKIIGSTVRNNTDQIQIANATRVNISDNWVGQANGSTSGTGVIGAGGTDRVILTQNFFYNNSFNTSGSFGSNVVNTNNL